MQTCNADYICFESTLHVEQKQRSLRGKQKVSAFHKAWSATPCDYLAGKQAVKREGSVQHHLTLSVSLTMPVLSTTQKRQACIAKALSLRHEMAKDGLTWAAPLSPLLCLEAQAFAAEYHSPLTALPVDSQLGPVAGTSLPCRTPSAWRVSGSGQSDLLGLQCGYKCNRLSQRD